MDHSTPMRKRSRTRIEELAEHVRPFDHEKDFCMVQAIMDESGIHDGADVCVIAGYWGSVKKWQRFDPQWKEIIRSAGEPSVREFHSTEFWNASGERRGVFAKWSDAKADRFIQDFADCIVDSRTFPTSAVLVTSAWEKLNKEERMYLTGGYYDPTKERWTKQGAPNKRYFPPFQLALANPAIHCPPGLHVHYVFDLNKQFKTHAVNLFKALKSDKKASFCHRMGGIDFESSEDVPGLQAADLLAYQTYKFSKYRMGRTEPVWRNELPPLLRKLISNAIGDQQFPFLNEKGLNIWLQRIPAQFRGPGWHRVKVEPVKHARAYNSRTFIIDLAGLI